MSEIRKPTAYNYSRRSLLLGAAATAGGLSLPFIGRANAAGPIKIGVLVAESGVRGLAAKPVHAGIRLGLARHGGKILGQPVEFVALDESDVATAQANMKKLIEQKVVGIIGGTGADTALAIQEMAIQVKIPLIIHSAMQDELTGANCNRWSYRVATPLGVQLRALEPYLVGYGDKWFTVGVDSTPSKAILAMARAAAKHAGATEVGSVSVAAGGNADFTAAIAKIKELKPDVVIGGLQGDNITAFLKAWQAAGMKDKIPFAQVGAMDGDIYAAGKDAADGIITKTWHYNNPKNSKEDKDFVAAFMKEFNGEPPGTRAWQAYIAMRSLAGSIDKAESPEPEKVREALTAFRRAQGDMVLSYRASDHQMMHRVAVLETKSTISDKYDWWDVEAYFPEKLADLADLYGGAQAGACKMPTS